MLNVHTLKLNRCNNIAYVSALGNVHNLDLRGYRNITGVSVLHNVHKLHISSRFRIILNDEIN